jgi:nicotinate-nucleotide adenylyltransferase
MLPAARPPHRETPAAAPEHRFEMLRLATAAEEFLLPDDSEMRREGPSWMVDTLSGFRARCGAQPLVLIIGQDAANGLDGWREWRRLFELAHIAVMCRPGSAPAYAEELGAEINRRQVSGVAALHDAAAGGVVSMEISRLDIASTAIRALVAEGRSPLYLTPRSVIGYIREHGLYAC